MTTADSGGRFGSVEWAVAGRPLPGQETCGDHAVAVEVDGRAALFGVIDGLGHGPAAAVAAERAAAVIGGHLRASIARIDFEGGTLQRVGVGNVTATLVSRAPNGLQTSSFVRLASGIVGFQLARVPALEAIEMRPGHLLVIASDGITEDHLDELDFAAPAEAIADRILREHSRVTDDALVLVARRRGST